MKRYSLFLLATLVLSACEDAPPRPPVRVAEQPAGEAPVVARPAEGNPVPSAPVAEVQAFKVALDGRGLRLVNTLTGAARALPFGTLHADTLAQLGKTFRSAPRNEMHLEMCNAKAVRWWNGLTAWFKGDRFVGWSIEPSKTPLTTESGLGLGSTRRELEVLIDIELVPDSTLGTEFDAGGLAGVLTSPAQEATITHLWAGETCLPR